MRVGLALVVLVALAVTVPAVPIPVVPPSDWMFFRAEDGRPPQDPAGLLSSALARAAPFTNSTAPTPTGDNGARFGGDAVRIPARALALGWARPSADLGEAWTRLNLLRDRMPPPTILPEPRRAIEELEAFADAHGTLLGPEAHETYAGFFASLDPGHEQGLAQLLAGVNAAAQLRAQALAPLTADEREALAATDGPPPAAILRHVDLGAMYAGADVLLATIDATLPSLSAPGWPAGRASTSSMDSCGVEGGTTAPSVAPCLLVIGDGGNNAFRNDVPLLLDLGGDNTFTNRPGAVGMPLGGDPSGVSLALVLGDHGRDTYTNTVRGFAQGSGQLGLGVLVDLGGDDVYSASAGSMGYGSAGVGVLFDRAGNDRYSLDSNGQGFGSIGSGLLIDVGLSTEANTITGGSRVQGTGELGGSGLIEAGSSSVGSVLTATAGSDAQGQGVTGGVGVFWSTGGGTAAYRLARDHGQGHGSNGGTGMLVHSAAGSALYDAPTASDVQGAGDNEGIGILLDLSTSPSTYHALDRSQGSGYARGLGYLIDLGGGDTLTAREYAQGSGVVGGLGVLIDLDPTTASAPPAALDHMTVMRRGQGHGAVNGWGILIDYLGPSLYDVTSQTGGCCVQGVGQFLGVGILYDLEGSDTYNAGPSSQGSYYTGSPAEAGLPSDPVLGVVPGNVQHGGLGILWDAHGDHDHASALGSSQGYSTARGYGVFVDGGGSDNVMVADPETSQGCGRGGGTGLFGAFGVQNSLTRGADAVAWFCDPLDPSSGGGIDLSQCNVDRQFQLHVDERCYR